MTEKGPAGLAPKIHLLWLVVCIVLALPVVGFFAGVAACDACGMNPFSYLRAGAIEAVMATLAGGFVHTDKAQPDNAWPFIVPLGLAFYACAIVLIVRGRNKRTTGDPA